MSALIKFFKYCSNLEQLYHKDGLLVTRLKNIDSFFVNPKPCFQPSNQYQPDVFFYKDRIFFFRMGSLFDCGAPYIANIIQQGNHTDSDLYLLAAILITTKKEEMRNLVV